MKNIKAVIFDLDGVLTDTSEYHFQAWLKLSKELNIPFDRQANEKLRGLSRKASLDTLLGNKKSSFSEEEIQKFLEIKNNDYINYIKNITPENLFSGSIELIKKLKQKKYKIALASSSKNAKTVLKKLQIENEFDAITDGLSVKKTKPAPDIFLKAAELINTEPKNCLVIEDAQAGIDAAISAGMDTIGIGLSLQNADYTFKNLAEVNKNFDSLF